MTEEDRTNLRRTLYLVIMSSVNFEECCHKILKMNLGKNNEDEVIFFNLNYFIIIKLKFNIIN